MELYSGVKWRNGTVEWNGGMNGWKVEWNGGMNGMEQWSGVVEWNSGVNGVEQ